MEVLTEISDCDMIERRDKRNTTVKYVEPNEGERTLLSRDKSGMRSPSLDLLDNSNQEELINFLADILIDGFLWHYEHARKQETSSDLLSGFDQGTG